jgi:transcriptional regulator with XRE-family HTH domain
MNMFGDLMRWDHERAGLTAEQAARRLGVSPVLYLKLEAGHRWPSWETYDRIAETFGWPQSFR